MSIALKRQQKELLGDYEILILELESIRTDKSLAVLVTALKRAYAALAQSWTRDAVDAAVFFIDRCVVKDLKLKTPYAQRALLLARRTETIGPKLNR